LEFIKVLEFGGPKFSLNKSLHLLKPGIDQRSQSIKSMNFKIQQKKKLSLFGYVPLWQLNFLKWGSFTQDDPIYITEPDHTVVQI
jgi:hypothetical protein